MCEDRIHSLEQRLRESEKERQRYQNESNRIKEMMQRNVMSTRHAAQIGKHSFIYVFSHIKIAQHAN